MSNLTRSNSNVNNKNNLANVFLKQRLAQFDREQKYRIYHIERDKTSTNHFLTQIKQCDTFLTTGSLDLLAKSRDNDSKVSETNEKDSKEIESKENESKENESKENESKDTEPKEEVYLDCPDNPTIVSTPKLRSPKKRATPSTPVNLNMYLPPRQRNRLKNLSAVRLQWIREGSKKKLTDYERGEMFLAKLREKERYIASLHHNSSDEDDDYNPLLRKAKSGITRLPSFRKPPTRPYSTEEHTSRSRKTTITENIAKRLDSTFENIHLEAESNMATKSDINVKFPRVSERVIGPSVAWQAEEGGEDDEGNPPEDMMRVFLNLKMKVKPKPLNCRIDDFYSKLDEMKRKQDERTRSLPYYEKRRRWLMLTRGKVDDYEDSEMFQ